MVSIIDHYTVAVSLSSKNSLEGNSVDEQAAEPLSCRDQLKNIQKPQEDSSSEDDRPKLKFKCKFCKESFRRKDRLDRHVFSHTGEVFIQTSKSYQESSTEYFAILESLQLRRRGMLEAVHKQVSPQAP